MKKLNLSLIQSSTLQLAEEAAVAIELNGISFAVMMLTPQDLDDFAIGFLRAEGIIDHLYDIHQVEQTSHKQGITLNIQIAQRNILRLKTKTRRLKGTSGCGICGKNALVEAFPKLEKLPVIPEYNSDLLVNIRHKIASHQKLSKHSGAMHAAFWLDKSANITLCREDIGRHNALDKLIGAATKAKLLNSAGALLITSRCGAELVHKAIKSNVYTLISLASPTALAVNMANQHGLSLIHLRKDDPAIVYANNTKFEDSGHD